MKVKTIRMDIGKTINMGNYESLRLSLGVEVGDLEPGQESLAVMELIRAQLSKDLDVLVKRQVDAWHK